MIADYPVSINVKEISQEEAKTLAAAAVSAVGHADTANVFSGVLGVNVPANRATVILKKDETALVGQYIGPRLPEGALALPEGATIKWLLVTLG